MRHRLAYICTALIFCTGSALFLAGPAQCGVWTGTGLALLLTVVQTGVWLLGRRRTFLTYALTFIPSIMFELGMICSCRTLFGAGAGLIVIYVLFPKKWLATPRPSTSLWVGSLAFMLEFALLAGIVASL